MYENEEHKKRVIERGDGYEYIGSYRYNETTIDGKKSKSHIRVKCPYCGKEYDVRLSSFSGKRKVKCTNCCNTYENSFAYHIQQELQESLNKYWDWEKNNQLGINPYHIKPQSSKKIWIKCNETDYHGSYLVAPHNFHNGTRCPYCVNQKIHPKDSFGQYLIDTYGDNAIEKYWSKKNTLNPFEIAPKSNNKKVWILCQNNKIHNVNGGYNIQPTHFVQGCRCSMCDVSNGEERIMEVLDKFNLTYIYDKPYFCDLLSDLGNPLRPDFILPDHKIWIEYDGGLHFEFKKSIHKTEENFNLQIKYDERKDKYAKEHDWKLIRIPYWKFDNIEEILDRELNLRE